MSPVRAGVVEFPGAPFCCGTRAVHEAEPSFKLALHCSVVSVVVTPESPPPVVVPVSEKVTEPVGPGPAPVTVAW